MPRLDQSYEFTRLRSPKSWRSTLHLTQAEMVKLNEHRKTKGGKGYVPLVIAVSPNAKVYHKKGMFYNDQGSYTKCSGYNWRNRTNSVMPSTVNTKKEYSPCRGCFGSWQDVFDYLQEGKALSLAKNIWTGEVDTVEAPKEMHIKQTLEFQIALDELVQKIMEQLGFKQYKVTETSVNGGEVSVIAVK